MRFLNRKESGILLANILSGVAFDKENTVVVTVSCGGMVVANEVADKMSLPLDILMLKKISAPFNPDFDFGFVSEDGEIFYNNELMNYMGYGVSEVEPYLARTLLRLQKSTSIIRGGRNPIPLNNKDIIIVDDGIDSETTILMMIQLLRRKSVQRIIVAIPFANSDSLLKLRSLVDEVIVLTIPSTFKSVSDFYNDFATVTYEEVIELFRYNLETFDSKINSRKQPGYYSHFSSVDN
jgi:putative phosphoribosyl transferase